MLASLPCRYSGLGLRSARRTAPAAYFGGWASALPIWRARFPAWADLAVAILERGGDGVSCARSAAEAVQLLAAEEWEVPSWSMLAAGLVPVSQDAPLDAEPGEWRHQWQFFAADARERFAARGLYNSLPPTGQALFLNMQGRHAGDIFSTFPLEPAMTSKADKFLTHLRRRLWLPLGIGDACCPGRFCSERLDELGIHLLSCNRSGRLQERAYPFERTLMQICKEAGGRVSRPQPLVRRLGLTGRAPDLTDQRRIDFAVYGLDIFGGLPICIDATIVSPISTEGVPHSGCATDHDAVFTAAAREKYATYHDLVASNRCRFLVIAAGTGGRWSDDCVRLLRELARFRAESEPPLLRRSMELAFLRRWWSLLSVALHDSIAAALDPSLDVAEGLFPVADAIDVWARDPPHTSVLGCPA